MSKFYNKISYLIKHKYSFFVVSTILLCLFIFHETTAKTVIINPNKTIWHISAKKIVFEQDKQLYIAKQNVVIKNDKTELKADHVEFSDRLRKVFAKGNVSLYSGEDSISGDEINFNLNTETGRIKKGSIFLKKNNIHIDGENIRKTGESSYSADKGFITSCSPENPDWKISGKNIKVTIDGYGFVDHPILWANDLPALYSPFIVFPAKTTRQTGLLFPFLSVSDRKGIEYEQPFFISISKSMDATFYFDYMSQRGMKLGSEYRYIIDANTKGTIFFDFLEDTKTDDGTINTENYSFSTTPQRTNKDRYWFRLKHNHDLENDFNAKLDIDIISDEDYLNEFENGFTGFVKTKDYFEEEFGRSIDDYDDYTRKNSLNINKTWDAYTLNFDMMWYDNINARTQGFDDKTLQSLPEIQFDTSIQQVGSLDLFYSLQTQYQHFYRNKTDISNLKGHRADIYPEFNYPLKLGSFFSLDPSIGIRQTFWHTDDFIDAHGNSNNFRTRTIYDANTVLSTKIIRIFSPENKFADKIKHEIIPNLEYNFVPYYNQSDLPYFDSLDRIKENNTITLSLANNFISKKGKKYRDFAFFELSQDYRLNANDYNGLKDFSSISFDTWLHPTDYIYFDMDLSWSPYDSQFETINFKNTLQSIRNDSFTTEYRYEKEQEQSIYSKINIQLVDGLSTHYSFEKNLEDNKTIETRAGINFERSCWNLEVNYEENQGGYSIAFLITLNGIGEFKIN